MVSTRSGRVVGEGEPSASGRPTTRSRARAQEAMQPLEEEVGQPEVTSPLHFKTRNAQYAEPGSPEGRASEQRTPLGTSGASPLTERVVKTVGKTAPTPAAKEVKKLAGVPLPDDGAGADETPPYVSSDSEDLPISPGAGMAPEAPRPPSHGTPGSAARAPRGAAAAAAAPRARNGGGGGGPGPLLGLLALTSVLATLLLGVLLAPCSDPALYATVRSPHYARVCAQLVAARGTAADLAASAKAQAAAKAAELYGKLPPAAQEAAGRAWGPLAEAHAAARPLAAKYLAEAEAAAAPLGERALEAWRDFSRRAFTLLAPHIDQLLERLAPEAPAPPAEQAQAPASEAQEAAAAAPPPAAAPPAPKPEPITVLPLEEWLGALHPSPRVQAFAAELWDAAGAQAAAKRKAPVWALTCRGGAECDEAVGVLFTASRSFFRVEGGAYSSPEVAGSLQSELVTFVRSEPSGLVIVVAPHRMHAAAVAVLNAATSEGGHLTHHGVPVDTHRALFVVLVEGGRAAQDPEAPGYEAAVKEQLERAMEEGDTGSSDEARAVIRSFRRRLDAVLPARALEGDAAHAAPGTEGRAMFI